AARAWHRGIHRAIGRPRPGRRARLAGRGRAGPPARARTARDLALSPPPPPHRGRPLRPPPRPRRVGGRVRGPTLGRTPLAGPALRASVGAATDEAAVPPSWRADARSRAGGDGSDPHATAGAGTSAAPS